MLGKDSMIKDSYHMVVSIIYTLSLTAGQARKNIHRTSIIVSQ